MAVRLTGNALWVDSLVCIFVVLGASVISGRSGSSPAFANMHRFGAIGNVVSIAELEFMVPARKVCVFHQPIADQEQLPLSDRLHLAIQQVPFFKFAAQPIRRVTRSEHLSLIEFNLWTHFSIVRRTWQPQYILCGVEPCPHADNARWRPAPILKIKRKTQRNHICILSLQGGSIYAANNYPGPFYVDSRLGAQSGCLSANLGGFSLNQASFRRNSIGVHLLSKCTERSEPKKRPYPTEQYQSPVGPGFWCEGFLPNLLRLILSGVLFGVGGWLTYDTGAGCI